MTEVVDRTDGRSLRSIVADRALAQPRSAALVAGSATLTYAAMIARAQREAACLLDRLGRRAGRVAILGHRSTTSLTAPLTAFFAGATFVPVQPNAPLPRSRRILESADVDAIIVDAGALPKAPALLQGLPRVPLMLAPDADDPPGALGARDVREARVPSSWPALVPEDLACLLFTSGSTGEPKGVAVSHGNVLAFLDVARERWSLGSDDRVAQVSDQTFDLSLFDLFAAWDAGAAACSLSSPELLAPARALQRMGCTAWFSVPSVIAHLRGRGLLRPGVFPTLRLSLFAGEPLPLSSALAWREAAPRSVIECCYGPTETTIVNFGHRFDPESSPPLCEGAIVPIGRPFPGTSCVVVDESLARVPDGEPGELLAGGAQVTPGYWRDDEQTRRRHVHVAFDGGPPRPWFRTGDRVRRLPSGDYAFLGRIDHQVKVSGYRIELGEIEAVLRTQPGVIDAVAVAWPRVEGGAAAGIVACVVPESLDAQAILGACSEALPPRAVPTRVLTMGELPRNANGKADRLAIERRLDAELTS